MLPCYEGSEACWGYSALPPSWYHVSRVLRDAICWRGHALGLSTVGQSGKGPTGPVRTIINPEVLQVHIVLHHWEM